MCSSMETPSLSPHSEPTCPLPSSACTHAVPSLPHFNSGNACLFPGHHQYLTAVPRCLQGHLSGVILVRLQAGERSVGRGVCRKAVFNAHTCNLRCDVLTMRRLAVHNTLLHLSKSASLRELSLSK